MFETKHKNKIIIDKTVPIFTILQMYGVEDKAEMDRLYIAMRVVTHGFGSLDSAGAFDSLSVDATESYHNMIKAVIDVMKKLGKKTEEIP